MPLYLKLCNSNLFISLETKGSDCVLALKNTVILELWAAPLLDPLAQSLSILTTQVARQSWQMPSSHTWLSFSSLSWIPIENRECRLSASAFFFLLLPSLGARKKTLVRCSYLHQTPNNLFSSSLLSKKVKIFSWTGTAYKHSFKSISEFMTEEGARIHWFLQ